MKYMGSKNRHAKELLPIILKHRKPGQWYVEPFAGGMNMIDKVSGNRIANDCHKELIACFDKACNGGGLLLPEVITEDVYNDAKNGKMDDAETGFIGFSMSFGGKYFGGYRRDVAGTKGDMDNMINQTRRSVNSFRKQTELLKGVIFLNKNYADLNLKKTCVIYCDPPYCNTTKYKTDQFDHEFFWQWVRDMVYFGHKVFVSEYIAPDDFVSVFDKKVNNTLVKETGSKQGVEKLFIHKSQII